MTLRWNLFILFLLTIFVFLQYKLWFDADGMLDMLQVKKKLTSQKAENEKILKSNQELLSQIEQSQQSEDSTESRARNELGMIKKGEIFYQIVKSGE